jgi:hypothetical protein
VPLSRRSRFASAVVTLAATAFLCGAFWLVLDEAARTAASIPFVTAQIGGMPSGRYEPGGESVAARSPCGNPNCKGHTAGIQEPPRQ